MELPRRQLGVRFCHPGELGWEFGVGVIGTDAAMTAMECVREGAGRGADGQLRPGTGLQSGCRGTRNRGLEAPLSQGEREFRGRELPATPQRP